MLYFFSRPHGVISGWTVLLFVIVVKIPEFLSSLDLSGSRYFVVTFNTCVQSCTLSDMKLGIWRDVSLSASVHSPNLFLVLMYIEGNKTRDLEQTRPWHRLTQWTNWFDTIRTPDLKLHTWQMCRRSCRYRKAMSYTLFLCRKLSWWSSVCPLFVLPISKRTNEIYMKCKLMVEI